MNKLNPHILKLISLYTTKEINEAEFNELQLWLNEAPENKVLFADFLLFYKKSRQISFTDYIDKDKAWNKIVSKIDNPLIKITQHKESKLFPIGNHWFKYAAAAIFVGILTTTYLFRDQLFTNPIEVAPVIVETDKSIEAGTDKATLTLENGAVVVLKSGDTFQTKNATSNGKQIVYKAGEQIQTKIAYNYLTIPRGGQFFIKLSDGTQVWLNSESQLKYPVAFVDGEIRKVELVYGEAYFDVSPSTKHNGATFKVFTQGQEVEVFGTQFNIKAYKGENHISTTLVEGKVSIAVKEVKEYLKPNQQSNYNITENSMQIKTVYLYDEVSWRKGFFSFKEKPLKEIMEVLSRWYDVDIDIANEEIKNIQFNGILSRNQNIENILQTIKSTNKITYEIYDNKIFIK